LISSKKSKKIKFGKVLKGKMRGAKSKGKTKKNLPGSDLESAVDDLVIESSKVRIFKAMTRILRELCLLVKLNAVPFKLNNSDCTVRHDGNPYNTFERK
jgi:hypothetical protein